MLADLHLPPQKHLPSHALWVLVVSSSEARIYFRRGDALLFYGNIFSRRTSSEEFKSPSRDYLGPDGRRYKKVAANHQTLRRNIQFIRELCAYLDNMAGVSFSRIDIVTSREVAGLIRTYAGRQFKCRLRCIVQRDLTTLSPRELERVVLEQLGDI